MEIKDLKIGLTLSGGGVRAAVFHLGVLSRMADDNLLEKIKMTSTVSGGTLVTGLIYQSNKNKWPNSVEFKANSIAFIKERLTKRNLQLNAILNWIWPPNWFGKGRAGAMAQSMERVWNITAHLNDIPAWPRWNINATTVESGKSWRFIPNTRMGDWVLGSVDKPDIRLSQAMCCSAAVPYLIGASILKTSPFKWYSYNETTGAKEDASPQFETLHLWDGGAYDNLGMEALVKYGKGLEYRKEFNFLIVSDAAGALTTAARRWFDPTRLIDVTMDQVRALRARALVNHFENTDKAGMYIQIGDTMEEIKKNYSKAADTPLPSSAFTNQRIAELKAYPTTLWKMKEEDFDALLKHGWEVTDAVMRCGGITNEKRLNSII